MTISHPHTRPGSLMLISAVLVACSGSSATSLDVPSGDASVASVDASSAGSSHSAPGGPDAASADGSTSQGGGSGGGKSDAGGGLGGLDASASGTNADSGNGHGANPDTCLIGGVTYQEDDDNPANICQWCSPAQSTTAWSNITDGAACAGSDQACFGGICTSNFPDCVIDGTAYPPNAASPTNPCALCQPRQSETAWTNAPDGTACTGGSCFAGACD